MTLTVSLGHTLDCAVRYLDQNGNPMLTTPVPDTGPIWTNTTTATETLTPEADGTCQATTVAAGGDEIDASVIVSGSTLKASLPVIVQSTPQVLTSIEIVVAVT